MAHDMTLAWIITGGILFGLLIVVGLPVVLGIRMSARHRELEHLERMKALELGRPWPGETLAETEAHAGSSSERSAKIGVWVPLGALGIAFVATPIISNRADMTHMAIWISAAAVGVTGVICGTILAMRTPQAPPPISHAAFKPPLEDDALDIVSRGG